MIDPDKGRRTDFAFRWFSGGPLRAELDLRVYGWQLVEDHAAEACMSIVDTTGFDSLAWMRFLSDHCVHERRTMLALGVENATERAMMLHIGFGDSVHDKVDSAELVARAERLAEAALWLPRRREIAGLQLDLLAREAYARDTALNLNPREFALIWRLADTPDRPVSKEELIHDVWRMGFVPETNSIAVHMSRLRRKLSIVGLAGAIQTVSSGGYCLVSLPVADPARIQRYGNGARPAHGLSSFGGATA